MKTTKIKGRGRSFGATAGYIADIKGLKGHNTLNEKPFGPKVMSSGSINTMGIGYWNGAKELKSWANGYKGRGVPTAHYVISWRANEYPTHEQIMEGARVLLRYLGYANHPAIWAIHNNTKYLHIHILVSRLATDLDARGRPYIGSSGSSIHMVEVRNGKIRKKDNEVESRHAAEAEICRIQGWKPTENARYDANGQRTHLKSVRDQEGFNLHQNARKAEEQSGQPSAARILARTVTSILRQAQTEEEALADLAKAGVVFTRTQARGPKNCEGGRFKTATGARVALSSLPEGYSLKALDARFGCRFGGGLTAQPSASLAGAAKIAAATSRSSGKPLTLTQVRKTLPKMLSDSTGWADFLAHLQRRGWHLERAGKSGALIVAGEHRIKMSDIPGANTSYGKVSVRFGETIEQTDIPADLLEIVHYPPRGIDAQADNPDAPRLPGWVFDDEILTGKPSPMRLMAVAARDSIRESLREDNRIEQLVSRLARREIEVRPVLENGILRGLQLVAKGVPPLSLSALPMDCRLGAIARAFRERYSSSTPMAEEGVFTKLLCTFLDTHSFNKKFTDINTQTTNTEADLAFIVPQELSKKDAERWSEQQILRVIFSKISDENDFKAATLKIYSRGWRIEATGKTAQVIINKSITIKLHEIGVDYECLCDAIGHEPNLPIAGWEDMTTQQRRRELTNRELRQAFRGSWNDTFKALDIRGLRLEATGVGGRIVLPDGSRVKMSEFGRGLSFYKEKKEGDFDALLSAHTAKALSRSWQFYQSARLMAECHALPDPQAVAALRMRAQGMSRSDIEACLVRDGLRTWAIRKLSRWIHSPRGHDDLALGLENGTVTVERDKLGKVIAPAKQPVEVNSFIARFRAAMEATGEPLSLAPDIDVWENREACRTRHKQAVPEAAYVSPGM